jgi:bifunctional N-acetylglucosamine-1-phosphate-uridyltransferase/glucosamine-1-phosphate-acetyltransferase GlmU-like protein
MSRIAAVILCGGKGSRMMAGGEVTHKPLLEIGGVPSTKFVIEKLERSELNFEQIIVVAPTERVSEYENALIGLNCEIVAQKLPLGTGNAVYETLDFLASTIEHVYVSFGTQPLIRNETIEGVFELHQKNGFGFSLATTIMDNPYAPLVRDGNGLVIGSLETHLDGIEMPERGETNVGAYWASKTALQNVLIRLHQELYIMVEKKYNTISGELGYPNEMVKGCLESKIQVEGVPIAEEIEMMGIKTPETLAKIREIIG